MYFETPRDKYHQDTTQILSIQEMGHSYQYECGGCWTRRTLEPLIPSPSVRVNSESVPCATFEGFSIGYEFAHIPKTYLYHVKSQTSDGVNGY